MSEHIVWSEHASLQTYLKGKYKNSNDQIYKEAFKIGQSSLNYNEIARIVLLFKLLRVLNI